MTRTQTFVSALILIALLTAWVIHGPAIRAAYADVMAAKADKK